MCAGVESLLGSSQDWKLDLEALMRAGLLPDDERVYSAALARLQYLVDHPKHMESLDVVRLLLARFLRGKLSFEAVRAQWALGLPQESLIRTEGLVFLETFLQGAQNQNLTSQDWSPVERKLEELRVREDPVLASSEKG